MKSAHLKGKGQRPHTNKQIDGKGKTDDPHFNYNMTILIGCSAEVTTRGGEVYEGIYVAFSQDMEILLEAAHLVTDNKDDSSIDKHFDVLVIPSEKVLSMKCKNADLTYPTREFATDTAISSSRGGGMRDKELTPWECTDDTPEELTLDSGTANANGWEAKDMFKKNEEKYGVVSTFKQDLSGYTTQVNKEEPEFKRLEEQANQIAQEIEKGTSSWERTQVENGDEEEAFSAVVRPRNNTSNSTVNNNNNNNTSSVGVTANNSVNVCRNDKYIPPSRRQTNMQPSAPPAPQSHPPSNNNGPSHNANNNSGGMARKPMYNQNQNPRNNYGAPPNTVYHQDRRNFQDSRRAPPPNQYGNNAMHGDIRRPPPGSEDPGPRPQRMNKQVPMDRKDPAKLKEFGNTFRLQSSEPSQQPMRRPPPGNVPPLQQVGVAPPHVMAATNPAPTRNPSPPSAPTVPISSNKIKKEESPSSLPPLIPPPSATSEPANPPPPDSGPHATSKSNASNVTPSTSSVVSTSASPVTPSVANISVSESTPTSTSSMTSPASSDNQTPSATGDSKSGDLESKKKSTFTFNPNAKEFNPNPKFSRSPSTPPRPPSTPASAATPQVMTAPAIHPYAMPISMQPILYAHAPAQQYAQAATLTPVTPSSNSSTSSGVTTPRHGGHRKGVVGLPPRSEMTPPIQMTTGPPILAPATAIQAGPPHAQYFVSQAPYPVMRIVSQSTAMPVFQSDGQGGNQIHPQMHYLPPNGANPQNNTGHQQNSNPQGNPAQTSVVPSNGHGYGQNSGNHQGGHHMSYPIAGVPVVYGFPSAPPNHVIPVPYLPHQVSALHKLQTQTLASSDAMLQHKNWNIIIPSNNTLLSPRP